MDEADRCGRGGAFYMSKLVALGTIGVLQRLPEANPPGTSRVQIEREDASAILGPMREASGVREATIFGRAIHALVETVQMDSLRKKFPEAKMQTIVPSLEDVFVTLTYGIMKASG
jgi:ABC-2 type transport system ATP-binding protein